jgi:hypothetical protein
MCLQVGMRNGICVVGRELAAGLSRRGTARIGKRSTAHRVPGKAADAGATSTAVPPRSYRSKGLGAPRFAIWLSANAFGLTSVGL